MGISKRQASSPRAGNAPARAKRDFTGKNINPEKVQLSERVDALKAMRGGKDAASAVVFAREVDLERDVVRTTLTFPNGDRIGGEGATTEEAVAQLEERMEGFPK